MKLVRDRIPEICRANGQEPVITVAAPGEVLELLRDKLTEEAGEVRDADAGQLPGELADVLEVVYAIAERSGISRAGLEQVRQIKADTRGGFRRRLVWHGNRERQRNGAGGGNRAGAKTESQPLGKGERIMEQRRYCFQVFPEQRDEHGFIPSVVTEGEPGHSPLTGKGELATPWYWGKTYEEAKATAEKQNAEIGVTPEAATDILVSSLRASNELRERVARRPGLATTPRDSHGMVPRYGR